MTIGGSIVTDLGAGDDLCVLQATAFADTVLAMGGRGFDTMSEAATSYPSTVTPIISGFERTV